MFCALMDFCPTFVHCS